VTRSTDLTIYKYHPTYLLIAYAISIASSLICVLLGLRAVWLNGVCHGSSFSSIMSTTRNKHLDDVTSLYSLGAVPTPRKVGQVGLRFGELKGEKRAGFGVGDEVVKLVRGKTFY
jgi:hypothetical protein